MEKVSDFEEALKRGGRLRETRPWASLISSAHRQPEAPKQAIGRQWDDSAPGEGGQARPLNPSEHALSPKHI